MKLSAQKTPSSDHWDINKQRRTATSSKVASDGSSREEGLPPDPEALIKETNLQAFLKIIFKLHIKN